MKHEVLVVGTKVIAIKETGPIREGQPGIVTGTVRLGFWSRRFYLCTFHGGIPLAVRPKEVDAYDHGFSLAELQRTDEPGLSVAEQLGRLRPSAPAVEEDEFLFCGRQLKDYVNSSPAPLDSSDR